MNFYSTNPVRKRHGFSWREEYLLGLLAAEKEMPTKDVLRLAGEVMSENTTHKYLTRLVKGAYVIQLEEPTDKRFIFVRVTDKGQSYLKELQSV
jgi:DNA-binding MarR family transcriptional regulator